jgi:ABC-type transport system involved in cytochrome c biogenesis ATPase subunit
MTPPNNTAAERHLLGVLLRDALPFPAELVPSDFFEPAHQDIAQAIYSLQCDGMVADELTVTERLRFDRSTVDAYKVSEMVSACGQSTYRQEHVDIVQRMATLREAARLGDYAHDPATDADALLAHAEAMFAKRKAKPTKHGPQRMDFDALLSFERKEDPTTILGNHRWLCKGGSLLIVGQSGTGKSSLMMQAAVHWCLGRDFFGIKPAKPLRAIVLQAENDQGDISEALQDVIAGAYIDSAERSQLKDALAIYRDTVSTGTTFTKALRDLVVSHQADIVFVDPLLSFAGIDVSDQEQASKFLRHDLAPILLETGAVLVAMHHTGKPKASADKEGQTTADLAYAGLGSSEFTNWFREVAVLFRCQGEEPIYKFGLTKRRSRAGLKDHENQFKGEIYIRHAAEKGVIRWEYSQPPSQSEPDSASRDAVSRPAKASPRRLGLS